MDEGLGPLTNNANTIHLPSFKQRSQIREEEIYNPVGHDTDLVDIRYTRRWSPRPHEDYNPTTPHISQAYTASLYEEDSPPARDIDRAYTPNPIPRFQGRGGEPSSILRNVNINPAHTPSIRQQPSRPDNEYAPPVQDITLEYAPNARRWSHRRGEEQGPIPRDVDANPMNTPNIRQWPRRSNEEYTSPAHNSNSTYAPSIGRSRSLLHRTQEETAFETPKMIKRPKRFSTGTKRGKSRKDLLSREW